MPARYDGSVLDKRSRETTRETTPRNIISPMRRMRECVDGVGVISVRMRAIRKYSLLALYLVDSAYLRSPWARSQSLQLPIFLRADNLKLFITEELVEASKPVPFRSTSGSGGHGRQSLASDRNSGGRQVVSVDAR